MNIANPLIRLLSRGLAALILSLPMLAFACAQVNDNFDSRLTLTGTASGDITGATLETGEPTTSNLSGNTVWWTWTPPVSGIYWATATSNAFFPAVRVFTGDSVDALTLVARQAWWTGDVVGFAAQAGTSYQICVDSHSWENQGQFQLSVIPLYTVSTSSAPAGAGNTWGGGVFPVGSTATVVASPAYDYQLTSWTESGTVVSTSATYTFPVTGDRVLTANYDWVPVPANDNFASRQPITSTDTVYSNNVHATREPGEPVSDPNRGGKSVWWTWTPSFSGTAGLQVAHGSYYPSVAIFTGTSLESLGGVPISWPYMNELQFQVVKGTAYQIMVDDPAGGGGEFDFFMRPPEGPQFQIPNTSAAANHAIEIPVNFNATGDETSLAWSVTFDPTILKHPRVLPPKGIPNATFKVDASHAASGQLGMQLQLPSGHTLGYGSHELGRIRFAPVSHDCEVQIGFGDAPVTVLITDRFGDSPAASFTPGTLDVFKRAVIEADANPAEGGIVTGTGEFVAGSSRILTAIPAHGWKFAGWDDDVQSRTRSVKVSPDGNYYTAYFEPDEKRQHPFKGSYLGSLSGQAGSAVTIAVGASGAFTGSVTIYGRTFRFHGRLDSEGSYYGPVSDLPGWPLSLEVDKDYGEISGSIGDFNLNVTRSMWDSYGNTKALAGRYTVLLKTDESDQGNGYGVLTVGEHGEVRTVGKICDGSTFAQSTRLTGGGTWSFYAPLYSGAGYLGGKITFGDPGQGDGDLQGDVEWYMPPQPLSDQFYYGVDSYFTLIGARFTPGVRLVDGFLNTPVSMSEFSTNSIYSGVLTLAPHPNDLASVPDSNGRFVSLHLNSNTGILTGDLFGFDAGSSGAGKHTPFRGVILQNGMVGGGYFLDGGTPGRFNLNLPDDWVW